MITDIFKKKRTGYVGWKTYKNKIDFLSEFYSEQAHLHTKVST